MVIATPVRHHTCRCDGEQRVPYKHRSQWVTSCHQCIEPCDTTDVADHWPRTCSVLDRSRWSQSSAMCINSLATIAKSINGSMQPPFLRIITVAARSNRLWPCMGHSNYMFHLLISIEPTIIRITISIVNVCSCCLLYIHSIILLSISMIYITSFTMHTMRACHIDYKLAIGSSSWPWPSRVRNSDRSRYRYVMINLIK